MAPKGASSPCNQYLSNMLYSVYAQEETRMVRGLCGLSFVNLPKDKEAPIDERVRLAYSRFCAQRKRPAQCVDEAVTGLALRLKLFSAVPEKFIYAQFVASYPEVPELAHLVTDDAYDKYASLMRRMHLRRVAEAQIVPANMLRSLRRKLGEDAAYCSSFTGDQAAYEKFILRNRDVLSPYFMLEHEAYRDMVLSGRLLKSDRVVVKLAVDRAGECGLLRIRELAGRAIHEHGIEGRVW